MESNLPSSPQSFKILPSYNNVSFTQKVSQANATQKRPSTANSVSSRSSSSPKSTNKNKIIVPTLNIQNPHRQTLVQQQLVGKSDVNVNMNGDCAENEFSTIAERFQQLSAKSPAWFASIAQMRPASTTSHFVSLTGSMLTKRRPQSVSLTTSTPLHAQPVSPLVGPKSDKRWNRPKTASCISHKNSLGNATPLVTTGIVTNSMSLDAVKKSLYRSTIVDLEVKLAERLQQLDIIKRSRENENSVQQQYMQAYKDTFVELIAMDTPMKDLLQRIKNAYENDPIYSATGTRKPFLELVAKTKEIEQSNVLLQEQNERLSREILHFSQEEERLKEMVLVIGQENQKLQSKIDDMNDISSKQRKLIRRIEEVEASVSSDGNSAVPNSLQLKEKISAIETQLSKTRIQERELLRELRLLQIEAGETVPTLETEERLSSPERSPRNEEELEHKYRKQHQPVTGNSRTHTVLIEKLPESMSVRELFLNKLRRSNDSQSSRDEQQDYQQQADVKATKKLASMYSSKNSFERLKQDKIVPKVTLQSIQKKFSRSSEQLTFRSSTEEKYESEEVS